ADARGGHRLRSPPAARLRHGRRAHRQPGADPLHDAGDLSLSRPPLAMAYRTARRDRRGPSAPAFPSQSGQRIARAIFNPAPSGRMYEAGMAGHSQFKNIMHKKGKQDAIRSKLFSKLAREITVAAKLGLPDPAMNPRLRAAVIAARAENMPKDNIERAIKKAAGGDAENYDEVR